MSMVTTGQNTFDNNLRSFGYAPISRSRSASTSIQSISRARPRSSMCWTTYDQRMKDAGNDDKVITFH